MQDRSSSHNARIPDLAPRPRVLPLDRSELLALNAEINAILPPRYQDCFNEVEPSSMGSAGLKFGPDGRVAWGEIWTHFCDLALAGGPPHRGSLLEPASAEDALAEPESYGDVVNEIGRGVWLTTELPVLPRVAPGWVGVCCRGEAMAAWLIRAVTAENVMARHKQNVLYLPAGPDFRLEKEIKNVVTVLAKTCHYWTDHMTAAQRDPSAVGLRGAAGGTTLLEPATAGEARDAPGDYRAVVDEIEHGIRQATGWPVVPSRSPGWVGVECADEAAAVWLMRAAVVKHVLARREGRVLHLPANPKFAAGDQARTVVETFARVCRLWEMHVAMGQRDREEAS